MRGYEPDENVIASYAKVEDALARFARLAHKALSDGQANLANRRDLRETLSRVGGDIARFYDGFSFPGSDAGQPRFDEANRRQRAFLDTLASTLSEALSLALRRFRADAADSGGCEPFAPETLSKIGTDTAPSQDTINALSLFKARAREALALHAAATRERNCELEREFVAVKLKAFLEATRWLETENPELLFKAATKLERVCSSDRAVVERGPVADLRDRVVVAWRDGEGEHARYSESGVALAIDFVPRASSVTGHVETIEGRVSFRARDPAQRDGAPDVSGEAFLAKLGFVKVVAALRAALAARAPQIDAKRKLADSVGRALDDIL